MFEVRDDDPRPIFTYFSQQFIAVLAIPIAGLLIGGFMAVLPPAGILGLLWELPLLSAGFVSGYKIPKSRTALQVARWTWCLPLFLFGLALMGEMRRSGVHLALTFFFSTNPGDDDRLATLLCTLPTWSAVSYSIGAVFKSRAVRTLGAAGDGRRSL